jgi:uncharacterized cupin superfamily protein
MNQTPSWLRLENRHSGEVLELRRRRDGAETVIDLRGSLPPHREGPPLHVHHLEDETGVIKAGTLAALVDGRRLDFAAGQSVQLPRGVAHRWWNDGDTTLVFEGVVRPAMDFDRYVQAAFEVINASPKGRPSLVYLAHVARRHRQTQSVLLLPRPLQAIVFGAAHAVGTLLGRYRGRDWPGCPDRCAGAPIHVD